MTIMKGRPFNIEFFLALLALLFEDDLLKLAGDAKAKNKSLENCQLTEGQVSLYGISYNVQKCYENRIFFS